MSSLMGGDQQAQGAPRTGGQTATAQQSAAVRNGSVGASGIQGGGQTPAYNWMTPQQGAGLSKVAGMSFEDWLKTLGTLTAGAVQKRALGGADAGLASFNNPGNAQGKHSISIASILGGSPSEG